MSKRTVFTTITPLPAGITRETVIETLHNHFEMIEYGSTSRPCITLASRLVFGVECSGTITELR